MIYSIISGSWLTADRLRVYPRIFLWLYSVAIVFLVMTSNGNVDMLGMPLGSDFVNLYAAGQLALDGQAPLAYDVAAHFAAQKKAIGVDTIGYCAFNYPPMILLLVTPLATLPYIVALLLWQGATFLFFVSMMWNLSKSKETVVMVLAFPAVFLNFINGQNAFMTAGLMAGLIYYLDRKPILSGLMICLLTVKPHLGVLIPVILLVSGRWRLFFTATGFSLLFAGLSFLFFGLETMQAFLGSTDIAVRVLNEGLATYYKMQSLFATVRLIGGSLMLAYCLHATLALTAVAVVIYVWRRPVDMHVKAAALVVGGLLIPPYLFDYDLTILGVAIICLVVFGIKQGFRPGLISLLALTWVAPILVRLLNKIFPLPWASILLSILLYQIVMVVRETQTKPG